MINVRKKLFDVAFQNPTGFCVIFVDFIRERAKSIDRSMRAFPDSARIRIGDKYSVKKRVKNSVNGVVKKTIPNARFVNVSGFRIIDPERLIRAVLVGMIEKVALKRENITREPH